MQEVQFGVGVVAGVCHCVLIPWVEGGTTIPTQLSPGGCSRSHIQPWVGGMGWPQDIIGAPWVCALSLHTQTPLLTVPGLPPAPHLPSSCPGTAL